MGNIFENDDWNYHLQKPETETETWYVKEKIILKVEYKVSLERSYQELFNGKNFENFYWNYYRQKPQTWYMSMMKTFFDNNDILYTA